MEKESSTNAQPPSDRPEHGPVPVVSPSGRNTKRIKIVVAGIVAAFLVAGGIATVLLTKKDTNKHGAYDTSTQTQDQKKLLSQNDPFNQQYLRGCKDRQVSFTQSPVPLTQLAYIVPMGKMSDGYVTPVDHMYLAPTNPQAADNSFDVVMPADGTVISVQEMPAEYIGDTNQKVAAEDHRLVIAHNCQYVSIFIHVHKLSDVLDQAVGGKMEPNTQKDVAIELKAGDKLGKIGGNPVDWTVADGSKVLSGFITPDLYKSEPWKIHAVDPIALYSGEAKTQLATKSLRSSEPYGGKIDYDKKGALIGNWFREGTNGYMGADQNRYWDGHLAIAPNYIDSSGTTFSVGNWNGKASQLTVKGTVDPATITKKSGLVKLELLGQSYLLADGQAWSGGSMVKGMKLSQQASLQGTALVQVMDGEKLKVELFPGKTAEQVSGFSAAAQTYVR